MRKRTMMGLVGAALLLVGLVGGIVIGSQMTAHAASETHTKVTAAKGDYCDLYEQTLANQLGVSTTALEQANATAIQQTMAQMQKDGTLTLFEVNALQKVLQEYESQPCAKLKSALSQMGSGHGTGTGDADTAQLQTMVKGVRGLLENAVAQKLNLSPLALDSDLTHGQTIQQLVSAQHVKLSDVSAAYLSAAQSLLGMAVANGTITQAQSDFVSQMLSHAVAAGHFPLLDKGGM